MRRAVFYDNLALIEAHNAAGLSWKLGVNEFAAMSHKEFVAARYEGPTPACVCRWHVHIIVVPVPAADAGVAPAPFATTAHVPRVVDS